MSAAASATATDAGASCASANAAIAAAVCAPAYGVNLVDDHASTSAGSSLTSYRSCNKRSLAASTRASRGRCGARVEA